MTADIFKYIDVEKTIAEFGYDPRELSHGSRKRVITICADCESTREVALLNLKRSIICLECSRKKRISIRVNEHKSEDLKGININKTKELFNVDPTKLKKGSQKKVFVNCLDCKKEFTRKFKIAFCSRVCQSCNKSGEKNWTYGMPKELHPFFGKKRSPETIAKMAKSMKGKIGLSGKKNPQYGKPARHGKGTWYERIDGSKVWMRSTYEVKYAEFLDSAGIFWEIEKKAFPVTYEYNGETKEGNYWPDFLVNGEWIEIKGFWRDDAKPKFDAFKAQYPDEKITLLMKPELLALGIDVK